VNKMISKFAYSAIAGLALAGSIVGVEPAGAATITDQTGSLDTTGLGLTDGNVSCANGSVEGASQCVGDFLTQGGNNDVTDGGADNPASKILASGVFDGITNWTFNAKQNVPSGLTGSNPLGFTI
jgi:ABC-type Fe3+ transport system substrate-binding protein